MPFNGAGIFQSLAPPQFPAVPGQIIRAGYFNQVIQDILDGLTNAITRDGQGAATADIPFGGFKLTNVAAGVADTDAANVGQALSFVPLGAGTTARRVQARLRETVSVMDIPGADPTGGTDNTAVFTAAGAVARVVVVPPGTFNLLTSPSLTDVILEITSGAVLTGPGGAGLGYTAGGHEQSIHVGTSGADFSTKYIRRNASHTGGAFGAVSGALKVNTFTGPLTSNFEWAITGVVDNQSAAGQNVGIYGQGIRHGAAVGATFGMVAEVKDDSGAANPQFSMVGHEVDCRGNGTDNLNNRVGIDVVVNRQNPGGAAQEVAYGIRLQNGGDGGTIVKTGVSINTSVIVGFDTSSATVTTAAYKMAQGQVIAFDGAAANQFSFDGNGLNYTVGGVSRVRLDSAGAGSILLGGRLQLNGGGFTSGGQTPTMGTNKPGSSGGGPGTWLSLLIDGNQYWVPAWSN